MNATLKNYLIWPLVVFFAVAIGLYPLAYVLADMTGALLSTKSTSLLQNKLWTTGFYLHIFSGGLALLIGWIQFFHKVRKHNPAIHRKIGYLYAVSVLLSGVAGLYISFYATGPWHTKLGFLLLAIFWLWTTAMAYKAILNKKVTNHQYWMMRSYALTYAAVTLRLWLPFLMTVVGWSYSSSYQWVAWLCWLPNLFLMELYICGKINEKRNATTKD